MSERPPPQTLLMTLNLIFDTVSVTGDITEVRNLLPQIPPGSKLQNLIASIVVNANPRRSVSVQFVRTSNTIFLTIANFAQSEVDKIITLTTGSFPPLPPASKVPLTETAGQEAARQSSAAAQPVQYLPGAFRPVPMPEPSDKDVFVIMSFDRAFRDAYYVAIEPTLKIAGLNPIRVDEIQHNQTVTSEIVKRIEASVFVVADLTGERPNVYYEIGYAHRADKEVILTAKKGTAVHFDVAAINRIEYEDFTELREALRKRVEAILSRGGARKGAR